MSEKQSLSDEDTVSTFQDAVDCSLQSWVWVGVAGRRGWGVLGLLGAQVVVGHLVVSLCPHASEWWAVTLQEAAGATGLLQFQKALCLQRVEPECCVCADGSAPSRVSVVGLRVSPVWRLVGAPVWLAEAAAGQRPGWCRRRRAGLPEQLGFGPAAEVFQEAVWRQTV